MPDKIYILMPDQSIRSVETQEGEMKIGRDSDNEIVIDHPSVSRLHARLIYDGERYTVSDLGSLNGTFIEKRQVDSLGGVLLQAGDVVHLGRPGGDGCRLWFEPLEQPPTGSKEWGDETYTETA